MTLGEEIAEIPRRNLPVLKESNRFFWTSGADGQLRFCRCEHCGHYVHPPAPACPACHSRAVSPAPVSGRAIVASFTINRQAWEKGLETPYVVALVEMDEQQGLRLTTNIVGCAPEWVFIGQRVRVLFDHREDVWLPLFTPLDATEEGR